MKHALRNGLIPVITVVGLQFGILMGGAILTETVFAWPGVGKWLFDGVVKRDYMVIQGGTLWSRPPSSWSTSWSMCSTPSSIPGSA